MRGEDEGRVGISAVPLDVDAGMLGGELARVIEIWVSVDTGGCEQVPVGLVGEVRGRAAGSYQGGGSVGRVGSGELSGFVPAAEVVAVGQCATGRDGHRWTP
ncbi:hypothetical protein [Actinokineospora cianjurensis]|uniref:Uncharacterized protein n=1 Tax=Actinokineospora cianjurensis TaxID=585224 RepID=A0A421B1Y9_9PSEU|nr:hypothetical protein [Actinokineospora cianjurensis]RLK58439.1 hypothetical protein CLV68_4543 [Actinokineospora cianjurensis]